MRHGIEDYQFQAWRQAVLLKDGFACKKCGSETHLHIHHIVPAAVYPKGIIEPANGIVLCKKCHKEFHSKYGNGREIDYSGALKKFIFTPPNPVLSPIQKFGLLVNPDVIEYLSANNIPQILISELPKSLDNVVTIDHIRAIQSLEWLQSWVSNERETGRITPIPEDTYNQTLILLKKIMNSISNTDPFSENSQWFIVKVNAIREVSRDLFKIRMEKIVNLAYERTFELDRRFPERNRENMIALEREAYTSLLKQLNIIKDRALNDAEWGQAGEKA